MTIAFSSPRLLTQVAALVGVGVLGLAVLSACDTDSVAAGPTETPTSVTATTVVAPRTTELPPITATETVGPAGGASASGIATATTRTAADCAPDIGTSAQVSSDATRIAPPRPGERWQAANAGGTRCPGLSYVYLVGPGGAPTEPKQLMIYHNGHFQGTGIRCTVRYQEVSASGPDTIEAVYRYPVADQPTQSPLGEADITFRWNGSRVVMDGSLPTAVTQGQC